MPNRSGGVSSFSPFTLFSSCHKINFSPVSIGETNSYGDSHVKTTNENRHFGRGLCGHSRNHAPRRKTRHQNVAITLVNASDKFVERLHLHDTPPTGPSPPVRFPTCFVVRVYPLCRAGSPALSPPHRKSSFKQTGQPLDRLRLSRICFGQYHGCGPYPGCPRTRIYAEYHGRSLGPRLACAAAFAQQTRRTA